MKMKTTKKYFAAFLVVVLGIGLTLIGANRGETITDVKQLETSNLLNLKTEVEITDTVVPKDVLKKLPGIKIGFATWGTNLVIQSFDLNSQTCVLISTKPLVGNKLQLAVRPASRSESAELDKIISDFEQSSGTVTGENILVGQPAFLAILGTSVMLLGVFLYIYALILDIKNKKLKSW